MKRSLLLAVLTVVLAGRAGAQQSRNWLRLGVQAYDFADYQTALPLLAAGMNPAAGPRDSLWVAGLHRVVYILLERRQDSLAAVWLRWGLRLKPDIVVDTLNFPPAVGNAFALAQRVTAGSLRDTTTETLWDWPATPPSQQSAGAIRLERSGAPVSVFIEGVGVLNAGEQRALPSGSYRLLASAPDYARVWLQREVLPGVTTVVRVRLRGPAAGGFLYLATAPWGSVYLDRQFVGYTPVAAYPLAVGTHQLRVERPGYAPFDTVVAVERDQRLRLGTIRLKAVVPP
ncbi:MAG TPA: PEGA domain-containing protein [Gemmatimonadales bacterium]|nr:PEGA domain-containing protein [Gemmatimonadales bacterium]